VPDSFDGRFELLVLHAHLMVRRLRQEGERGEETGQLLFDALTAHFDEALRAIGVGDMSVGKHVKSMTRGLYGRLNAYDTGLDAGEPAVLRDALRRNLYGTLENPDAAVLDAMAAYVRAAEAHLQGLSYDTIVNASGLYPEPPAIAVPAAQEGKA